MRDQPELWEFLIYLQAIREIKIPRGWVGNKKLMKILSFDDGASPVFSTPRKDRGGRGFESPGEEKSQRTRSVSPHSRSIYETPIRWGAKTKTDLKWKTY